jgi:predicted dehydrogenase
MDALFQKYKNSILIISTPPGLHAKTILEGNAAGFKAILCEKPSCVSLEEVATLRSVTTNVGIFHVYRQMWGLQALRKMIELGELGDLICIEGRYWQASAAARALTPGDESFLSWKNNPELSGESDTLLDIGSHWADAVCFLYGEIPSRVRLWRSYKNAERPHRDTHVQLAMDFRSGGRAFGSISKTFHGSTNHFEINLIGTKKSATWNFSNPDEIIIGEGRDRKIVTRTTKSFGSYQAAFHGLGWIEGYIEICRQCILEFRGVQTGIYPKLSENLNIIQSLLEGESENG